MGMVFGYDIEGLVVPFTHGSHEIEVGMIGR